jgi:hypothetical protein
VIPCCLLSRVPVRTRVKKMSASAAWLVQTFWPLTMYSSPSRRAVVRRLGRSEPASGSD